MAAVGAFRHWSLADLQTLKTSATTAYLAGANRFITSTASGDVQVSKENGMAWERFWEELNFALELKSPSSYTPRISRTKVRFS